MGYSISEFARRFEVSASTLRYYEQEKLLPLAERRNGRRVYHESDVPRLRLLLMARQAGFGVRDIKQLAGNENIDPNIFRHRVTAAVKSRLENIETEINRLQIQKEKLTLVSHCTCQNILDCDVVRVA